MKQYLGGLILLMAGSAVSMAQAVPTVDYFPRQQISVQGSGVLTRKVTDSGITFKPTSSAGGLVTYRVYLLRWMGVEGEYDFFQNSQKYITTTSTTSFRTNVHAATGAVVFNIPNPVTKRFTSFASIGGGALIYQPRNIPAIEPQFRNVIMFGGGVDFPVAHHLALRVGAKTYLYKAPDFKLDSLHTNKYIQTMVPSAGVVYSF